MSKSSSSRRKLHGQPPFGGQQKKSSNLTNQKIVRRGIWWLASFPKSGNTWARYMLESYYGTERTKIQNMQWIRDDIRHADYQTLCAKPCADLTDQEHLLLRPAMLHKKLVEHFDSKPIILKTHNCLFAHPEYIAPPWLTFGAIYIMRDPRDVCISMSKHNGTTIDATIHQMQNENAAIEMTGQPRFRHYLNTWSNHVMSWLDQDRIPVCGIRYEDILENPTGGLIAILDFIKIEKDMEHIKRAVEQSRFENMKSQEAKLGFKETGNKQSAFFNQGKAGVWKDKLSEKQVKEIERKHGAVMERYGYKLEFPADYEPVKFNFNLKSGEPS